MYNYYEGHNGVPDIKKENQMITKGSKVRIIGGTMLNETGVVVEMENENLTLVQLDHYGTIINKTVRNLVEHIDGFDLGDEVSFIGRLGEKLFGTVSRILPRNCLALVKEHTGRLHFVSASRLQKPEPKQEEFPVGSYVLLYGLEHVVGGCCIVKVVATPLSAVLLEEPALFWADVELVQGEYNELFAKKGKVMCVPKNDTNIKAVKIDFELPEAQGEDFARGGVVEGGSGVVGSGEFYRRCKVARDTYESITNDMPSKLFLGRKEQDVLLGMTNYSRKCMGLDIFHRRENLLGDDYLGMDIHLVNADSLLEVA